MTNSSTKKLVTLSMLCAVAYTVMFIFKATPPLIPFPPLKFDPKDVIIILGGFLYGPLSAVVMSVIVSILEMVSVSITGWVGCIQNIVSSCAFVVPAALVYEKRKTLGGAIIGLTAGIISVTAVMTLFNYLMVPIFMATAEVSISEWRVRTKSMLLPVFVPFNLFKSSLNAVLVLLIFKPVVTALHKAELIEPAIIGTRSTAAKWIFICAGIAAAVLFLLLLIL
jgi:riboflavin transporter FmnP